MDLNLHLSSRRITKLLLKIIGCLLLANLTSVYLKWKLGYITGLGFVPLFDFDQEYNIPTFYSALAILFCAALIAFIAYDKKRKNIKESRYWKFLCAVFILLSLDELASIHNQFSRLTALMFRNVPSIANEEIISQSRFWILAYLPLLFIVFLFLIRFFLNLPKQTRNSFFMAGTVFMAGAVGVELLGDRYIFFHGNPDIFYGLLYTLEEFLEMMGMVLFIRALISYISQYSSNPQINIQFSFLSPGPEKSQKKQAENLSEINS